MALLEKRTQSTLLGLGIGAGAVLLIPYVGGVLAAVARPLVKALVAGSMEGFERAAEKVASAAESFQDIVAEVRAARAERDLPVATSSVSGATGSTSEAN